MQKLNKKDLKKTADKYELKLKRSKPIQHEELMCKSFIKQLNLDPQLRKYAPYVFHIPNGGKRSAATGAKMKAMGTRKGFADYIVLKPLTKKTITTYNQYCGNDDVLFLEFKHGINRQSPEQKEFEKLVISCGHQYKVVWTIEDAIKEIKKFWGDK